MKLLIAVLSVFIATTALAQPYLGVDPDSSAEKYIIEADGVVYEAEFPIEQREHVTLIFDLSEILQQSSTHIIRAKAVNAWGDESEWSVPLEFMLSDGGTIIVRQQPGIPTMLRIILE